MKDIDKKRIIERYNERLERFGYDIKTLASGSEENRRLRFKILTEVGSKTGCSVLDLGCGFGDFYAYLKENKLECMYAGYDINAKLIEVARKKYPEANFEVKDIQNEPFPEFDFIVSTSAFNLKLSGEDNYDFIKEVLKICYAHSKCGLAVDFLSSYVDYEVQNAFYYSPERIFSIAKSITKRVCLRHDYPLFEFCIYLFPDFKGWKS